MESEEIIWADTKRDNSMRRDTLDNPIIPASGTFGYGYEFAELYDINMLRNFLV